MIRPVESTDERKSLEHSTLVLSSGGMRGLAHVGAWRALQEEQVVVERIVGSSIGALIGAAMATGMSIPELEKKALSLRQRDVAVPWKWPWWARGTPKQGLLRGDVLREFVRRLLPDDPEQRLSVPLEVSAVDLRSGSLRWFSFAPSRTDETRCGEDVPRKARPVPGQLVDAVVASMSIPGFYPPVTIGDGSYVDGGVLAPLPLKRAAELGARRIIAVDTTNRRPKGNEDAPDLQAGLLGVTLRAFSIATAVQNRSNARVPKGTEVFRIRPLLEDVGCLDFDSARQTVEAGYLAARRLIGPADVASASRPSQPASCPDASRRVRPSHVLPRTRPATG